MCDQQGLRSACAYAQSGQSLCLSIKCSVTVRLLTGRRLGFLCLVGGGAVQVRLGLRVSGGYIVGNYMPLLIYYPKLWYTCALEIFVVKTTSLSKVFLNFSPFSLLRHLHVNRMGILSKLNSASLFASLDSLREEFMLPYECYCIYSYLLLPSPLNILLYTSLLIPYLTFL